MFLPICKFSLVFLVNVARRSLALEDLEDSQEEMWNFNPIKIFWRGDSYLTSPEVSCASGQGKAIFTGGSSAGSNRGHPKWPLKRVAFLRQGMERCLVAAAPRFVRVSFGDSGGNENIPGLI